MVLELKEDSRSGLIHCISIIGQIEGHHILPEDIKSTKYEHLLPAIAAVEEAAEIRAMLILINTVGGDVEAGLAIAELIAGMSKPTASLVLGGGHSIGVPLAVSADMSFIVPSASMTLHPVRVNGLVISASQSYEYLQGMQERVTDFVVAHSNISKAEYTEMITRTGMLANDVGSILSGREAVEKGIIDRLGALSHALEYLHSQI